MTKPLKSLCENACDQLIKNQLRAALVQPAKATPLAPCATSRARRDPPGGPPSRHSLPLLPTPYSNFRPSTVQKLARMLVVYCGVGGDWLSLPRQGQGAVLIAGVRT